MPVVSNLDRNFQRLLTCLAPELSEEGDDMEEVFEIYNEASVPVLLMYPLPAFKVHGKLEMASCPSMCQEEYEDNILSMGPLTSSPDDELVTIVCPGETDGDITRDLTMTRCALQRSEPLNQFFKSKDYRFGCGIVLHFWTIPGLCFQLVKSYLELGPDRYSKEAMQTEVSMYYTSEYKRIEMFARTLKCAHQLELPYLENMVWAAIKDDEGVLTVENVIILVTTVFARHSGFGRQIKCWLINILRKHANFLNGNPVISLNPITITWTDVIRKLSPAFKKEWNAMIQDQKSPLIMACEEEDEDEYVARVFKSLDEKYRDLAMNPSKEIADDKPILPLRKPAVTKITSMEDEEEDDPSMWEDLDKLCPGPKISRATDDTKARVLLGAPANPRFTPSTSPPVRPSSFDAGTAKARSVMGINDSSNGFIAGRRKESSLSRAKKSLVGMIRSEST